MKEYLSDEEYRKYISRASTGSSKRKARIEKYQAILTFVEVLDGILIYLICLCGILLKDTTLFTPLLALCSSYLIAKFVKIVIKD